MNSGDLALWLLKVVGSVVAVAALVLGPSRFRIWRTWRDTKRHADQRRLAEKYR